MAKYKERGSISSAEALGMTERPTGCYVGLVLAAGPNWLLHSFSDHTGSPLVPGVLMCFNQGMVWGRSECRSVRNICREPKQLNDLLVKTQSSRSAWELPSMYIHKRSHKLLGDVQVLHTTSDRAVLVILYREGKNILPLLWCISMFQEEWHVKLSGALCWSLFHSFSALSSTFTRRACVHHRVKPREFFKSILNYMCRGMRQMIISYECIFCKHLLSYTLYLKLDALFKSRVSFWYIV